MSMLPAINCQPQTRFPIIYRTGSLPAIKQILGRQGGHMIQSTLNSSTREVILSGFFFNFLNWVNEQDFKDWVQRSINPGSGSRSRSRSRQLQKCCIDLLMKASAFSAGSYWSSGHWRSAYKFEIIGGLYMAILCFLLPYFSTFRHLSFKAW